MKRALLSPWFLFRVEVPNAPEQAETQPLTAHELATRLSYFCGAATGYRTSRAAADDGSLTDPAVLEEHTRRMLADPKAEALVLGFGAQWLGLEELHKATPDTGTYPTFTEPLREAMAVEMQDHIRRALLGEDSMMSLFTSDTRWVTPLLAEHYGLSLTEPEYVQVPTRLGGGLLTSAGLLTATSSTTRTSPVRRGFWVASEVFCEEPPPPPDAVEQEIVDTVGGDSVPDQLAAHRANPACAGCHNQLDPIGLALEQFDGIGVFRTHYLNGDAIETGSASLLVLGTSKTASPCRAISEQPKTSRCIVQKAVTYALGRKTNSQDWKYIEPIETAFREGRPSIQRVGCPHCSLRCIPNAPRSPTMSVSRRRFLRGSAGLFLALPILESMRPRTVSASDPTAPQRARFGGSPRTAKTWKTGHPRTLGRTTPCRPY